MKASLDRQLDALRAKLGIPGISAAIQFADGTVWTGTSGLADVAGRRAVTPDTPFAVGSISKTFTAALVVSLAGEDRLDLDASVLTYLPNLKIDRRITVRDLLDHMSGLNDYFFHPRIDAALLAEPGRRWSAADALGYVGKPYFPPGTAYHYSNTNYLILGMLAEAVGGAPIAEQLHARFLDPLGLTGTTYQGAEPPAAAPAHGYRFAGASVKLPRDRPDREILDRAVPVGSYRSRSGGFDSHDRPRPCPLGPRAVRRRRARRTGHSGRCSATWSVRPPTVVPRTASVSSRSPSTADRHSAIRADCLGHGPSFDGFRPSRCRSQC